MAVIEEISVKHFLFCIANNRNAPTLAFAGKFHLIQLSYACRLDYLGSLYRLLSYSWKLYFEVGSVSS